MSLHLYSTREEAKQNNLNVIYKNDAFFNGATIIQDTDFVRTVLNKVEKAKYYSNIIFTDRSGCNIMKNSLSTGTKTLLNIISYPDLCFDLSECGENALEVILKLSIGNAVWGTSALLYDGDEYCDIEYRGTVYHNIYDILDILAENGIWLESMKI